MRLSRLWQNEGKSEQARELLSGAYSKITEGFTTADMKEASSPSCHTVIMTPNPYEVGIGATAELSLRVSVATLVRVLFKSPNDDELMFALERKATLRRTEDGEAVRVKSQPFGGAIRILDLSVVQDLVGDFHFDSERSRAEQDFRIFIRPSVLAVAPGVLSPAHCS